MLLKKKFIFLLSSFVFFTILLTLSQAQVSSTCSSAEIKEALRKALFDYFSAPENPKLSVNEIKDLIHFFITTNTSQITLDCSGIGPFSGKPYYLMLGAALQITREIPRCTDGTYYGRCSSNMPYYCYGGKLVERCSLCGCGANARCDTSTNKCIKNVVNITCNVNTECGADGYVSLYFCFSGSVYRNYTMHTCLNPTTVNSRCEKSTSPVLIDKCSLGTYCKEGQSACQKNVTDLAPSVAISIAPKIVAVGQPFNITVVGTDDIGLSMIWWFGLNSTDAALNNAHTYGCNNATFCKNTWTVSTNAIGTFNIGANSRDSSYPVANEPHQASEGAGIAYDTVTISSVPVPSLDIVTIKGRLIDHFSQLQIANALIYTWDNQTRRDVYSNANGEFSTYADTKTITQTSPKGYGIIPKCYMGMGFGVFRKTDNSLYVNFQITSLIGPAKAFPVTSPEVNAGNIPMWPAVDVAVYTDIPVQFFIEYSTREGSGNVFYKTSHYLSNAFPLNTDTRIKLIDSAGKIYYSPYINLPLSHGCAPVKLNFFSNQFSWNVTQAIVSNATANCFVKVNGSVIKSVYATDRIDCYNKTSFGSINCQVYTPYFKDGLNFLEQYFGATDRVNNEYCSCLNGICVQGITNLTNQTKSITVLSPNGGEKWWSGNKIPITWKANNIKSKSVNVKILKGGNYFYTFPVATGTQSAETGIFNTYWEVPLSFPNGIDYTIEVSDSADASVRDVSDAPFTILQIQQGAYWTIGPNIDAYHQYVRFEYNASSIANAQYLRFYQKRPGDNSFNLVATFSNPSSATCNVQTTSSGWKLYLLCDAFNKYWSVDLASSFPASYFPVGEYSYYATAVDSAGEKKISPILKQYMLTPTTILSPTAAQSPTSSTPTFKWTIASGWPVPILPNQPPFYTITIYDESIYKSSTSPTPFYQVQVAPSGATEGSKIYDGPALEPTKRYVVRTSGWTFQVDTTANSHITYVSLNANYSTFWTGNQTNVSFKCTDSDYGLNYYLYGTTNGYKAFWEKISSNIVTEKDSCTYICSGSVGSGINASGPCLIEYYCDANDYAAFNVYPCPYGCQNGVCVNKTNQTTLQAPSNIIAGWGITNDNTKKSSLYFHAINFAYTDPVPTAFRVYLKKPGESAFNRAAEFRNLSAPCETITTTGSILSTGWSIYRRCNSNNWKIDSYWLPTTGYPQGVYRFYLTAVDSSGIERASPEFEMYNLQPLTISSPTSAQSPVAAKPTFQWTVASGWPKSPIPYSVQIFDDAKFGAPWIVHSTGVDVPTSSTTASYVYDGLVLDPAKKYVVRMYGLSRAYPTGLCPSCDYISMDTSTQTFWVSSNQTNVTTCTDSDGGFNIYKAGLTDGRVNGIGEYFYDTCVHSNGGACSDPICAAIAEGYCLSGKVTNLLAQCPNGCQNGACVNQTTSQPDLIVSNITFVPSNPTTADYTKVNFIIKNIGTATASNFSLKVDYVGGQSFLFGTGYLPAGATTSPGSLGNYWPAGTNTFIATVDVNNNVVELDENNNILTKSITITSTTNQTANQTCIGVDKSIDFEDPPHLAFHLTWNPDLGAQDSYNYNLDETARAWLKTKGINITGTPNGIVWGTKISSSVGTTGVVIGDASPNFLENDQGISDNEVLTVNFVNSLMQSVTVKLTSIPSSSSSINNVPATVVMDAFDKWGNLVATASKTFTGVTNGVYTPTTMSVPSTSFNIAKITLRTTQHPSGGVWLEDISFKACT